MITQSAILPQYAPAQVLGDLIIADEPTLGVIQGDDFYFVANSHWNRFDRENKLPEGLAGPIILKLPVN